jgi:hypothetical protein
MSKKKKPRLKKDPRKKLIRVKVEVGSLNVEWPPTGIYDGKTRTFKKGETFKIALDRAKKLGKSVSRISWTT